MEGEAMTGFRRLPRCFQDGSAEIPNRQDLIYAVAVRNGGKLLLALRVRRAHDGSVYVMWHRDPDSDPHTSYHASGKYWQRANGQKLQPLIRQPLDGAFHDSEMVISTFVQPIEVVVDPAKFTDVFEISEPEWQRIRSSPSNCLDVHLVQDRLPLAELKGMIPGVRILKQERYGDGTPWIVMTLWEPPSFHRANQPDPD